MTVVLAILLLGVIIIIHELGHYCVGRLLHVGIEEFSVGFGPKLIQWKRKDIRYSVRLILLGGYVRFMGEDENDDRPAAFNNQPVWKRFLTILSGPLMNFALALVLAVVFLSAYGVYQTVPLVGSVIEDTPAASSELMAGDRIIAINGESIAYDVDGVVAMRSVIGGIGADETIEVTVLRGEEQIVLETGLYVSADGSTGMGIYLGTAQVPMSFGDSLKYSGQLIVNMGKMMLESLRNLVFKGEGLDEMAGTVGVVSVVSKSIASGFDMVLNMMIVISLNVGIINLLPLPALDGGRLVFLAIEGIFRKPVPRDKEGLVHMIGLLAFFALFVVLTYQDIMRLIAG